MSIGKFVTSKHYFKAYSQNAVVWIFLLYLCIFLAVAFCGNKSENIVLMLLIQIRSAMIHDTVRGVQFWCWLLCDFLFSMFVLKEMLTGDEVKNRLNYVRHFQIYVLLLVLLRHLY